LIFVILRSLRAARTHSANNRNEPIFQSNTNISIKFTLTIPSSDMNGRLAMGVAFILLRYYKGTLLPNKEILRLNSKPSIILNDYVGSDDERPTHSANS